MQDIIKACRSYRRFDESDRIDRKLLTAWVDAARLVASSGNAQPLRYAIVSDERACERVLSCCAWAKALPDWPGPVPGERPSAYVVVCRDNDRTLADTFTAWDEGIAAQTIMLQAVEAGFGGCIIASFKKRSMAEALGVDADRFQPDLVLALGKPVEDVRIVDLPAGGATQTRAVERAAVARTRRTPPGHRAPTLQPPRTRSRAARRGGGCESTRSS